MTTCPDSQIWNAIVSAGYSAPFSAGSVLECLRFRNDIESARWYWARLQEMRSDPDNVSAALSALGWLGEVLRADEIAILSAEA